MQTPAIRKVEERDFDLWLPLWKAYQNFYEVKIPESVTHTTWNRFLDPAEPMHAALAMKDEDAVGLVHSIYHRSTWLADDVCYLQDLFVSPSGRGTGVGRALIEHVYAQAKSHGVPRVQWLTQASNHIAMRLYDGIADRSGFVQYRKNL